MKSRILPTLLATFAFAAQAGDDAAGVASPGDETPATPEFSNLPNRELTPQILYQILLAEIAGTRGQTGLSAEAYADLARNTRDPRVARRAAEIAIFARRYDLALESAHLWLAIEPTAPQARQMLTGLLAATNKSDELSEHLTKELTAAGKDVGPLLMQLNRFLARNPDKQAAQRLVNTLTEPYLALSEAHFARSQAAHNARDQATALGELDRALELRPDWEQAALLRSQMTTDAAEATKFLGRFIAANPRAHDARVAYARSLVNEKRFADARQEFRALLAEKPGNGDLVYAVGVLSLQVSDFDEAERQFSQLAGMNHAEVNNARLYLGQIAEDRKQWVEAIRRYSEVTAGGQYLPARMRLAKVHAAQGDMQSARRVLQESAATDVPERAQLLIGEAQLLREANRHDEAYGVLAEGLSAYPDQPELLYEAGLMAEKVGKLDVLERNLRRLIEIKPNHAHAYNALGYSLADRNERLDEAQRLIDKALELAPVDPFILDSKGWVLFRRGDAAGALDVLNKAFSLRADPEIAAHLGEVLWALGRRSEAEKTWSEAMKAHPGNEALVGTIKKFLP
jgi:tetratricopeptide (TPR) repeat protein